MNTDKLQALKDDVCAKMIGIIVLLAAIIAAGFACMFPCWRVPAITGILLCLACIRVLWDSIRRCQQHIDRAERNRSLMPLVPPIALGRDKTAHL